VNDFDPNDPLYWAMEHCQSDPRVKQMRWVNDTSVNLDFYSKEDATVALGILTHPDEGDTSNLSMQETRRAKLYSKKPRAQPAGATTTSATQMWLATARGIHNGVNPQGKTI
jgi:hypothetical protein